MFLKDRFSKNESILLPVPVTATKRFPKDRDGSLEVNKNFLALCIDPHPPSVRQWNLRRSVSDVDIVDDWD
jgi:hypothetical protein